jgi:hypothetical protein
MTRPLTQKRKVDDDTFLSTELQREEKKCEHKTLIEEMMTQIFPNLVKDINVQI